MKINKFNGKLITINLIILYLFINRFFIIRNALGLSEGITASFSIILLVMSILIFGYRKCSTNRLTDRFFKLIVMSIIIYFTAIYASGLAVGFLNNSYSLKPMSIIDNTFNIIFFTISIEIFRYIFVNSKENYGRKGYIYIITFLITLLETNLYMSNYAFSSISSSFKFITITFIPMLVKNAMCSYIVYHSDYRLTLLYRLIMDLYIYVVPLQPDLNDYFMSITAIVLPYIILMYAARIVEASNQKEKEISIEPQEKMIVKTSDIPFMIITLALACAILGIGPFKIIGIETGSMTPAIKVGDAVLVNKLYNIENLKEGDVIAYINDENIVVIHRIYKINADETFITKGDYNNGVDSKYVSKEQIQGKIMFKIPFIAYPAIYFKK